MSRRGGSVNMFYKVFRKTMPDSRKGNREIEKYFSSLEDIKIDRRKDKYYVEMQMLAFQLVRYLRMNDIKNEHAQQGSWNFTYLRENLTEDDFQYLVNMFIGECRPDNWKKAIKHWNIQGEKRASIEKMLDYSFVESDIGDSYVRIIYKPMGHDEIKRIVKKLDLAEAIREINARLEVEYLKTEVVDFKMLKEDE